MTFDLWLSAALFTIGAQFMNTPADLTSREAGEPDSSAVRRASTIEAYSGILLMLCFVLSTGFVWYEMSFLIAVLYVTAGVPSQVFHDLLWSDLEKRRWNARTTVVACLLIAPAIMGIGAWRLGHELIEVARTHAHCAGFSILPRPC